MPLPINKALVDEVKIDVSENNVTATNY